MSEPRSTLIHLDEGLAVFAKPPGLSLATRPSEPGAAVARLAASLSPSDRARLGNGELHLVHRLDVGTSGLVSVARDSEVHRELVRAFTERRVEKTYLALVWGRPKPGQGEWSQPLGPDRKDRRRMKVDPDGRPSRSRYAILESGHGVTLLELKALTGRTHQLRVHAAHAGHPIVGDDFYGGPRHHGVRDRALRKVLAPSHTLLHAWRLTVPWQGAARAFEAGLPPQFEAALAACGWRLTPAEAGPPVA
ncbi:MAG: RNA pseudouridine synthase [Acidobacteriota bacterium]